MPTNLTRRAPSKASKNNRKQPLCSIMKNVELNSKEDNEQKDLIPLNLKMEGSIPNSFARALHAAVCLFEEFVDFLIYIMRSRRK